MPMFYAALFIIVNYGISLGVYQPMSTFKKCYIYTNTHIHDEVLLSHYYVILWKLCYFQENR
jgi:hypothetical protein